MRATSGAARNPASVIAPTATVGLMIEDGSGAKFRNIAAKAASQNKPINPTTSIRDHRRDRFAHPAATPSEINRSRRVAGEQSRHEQVRKHPEECVREELGVARRALSELRRAVAIDTRTSPVPRRRARPPRRSTQAARGSGFEKSGAHRNATTKRRPPPLPTPRVSRTRDTDAPARVAQLTVIGSRREIRSRRKIARFFPSTAITSKSPKRSFIRARSPASSTTTTGPGCSHRRNI